MTTAAIKSDGTLWTWGNNNSGELGNGNTTATISPGTIVPVGTGTGWKYVSAFGNVGMAAINEEDGW
jgi:hypothetical protein